MYGCVVQDAGTATEDKRLKAFGTNTPTRRLADAGGNTEPVRIVADPSSVAEGQAGVADKGVATDRAVLRSVHAGTEAVELREKGVGGPLVRTREAGTMPATTPTDLLPGQPLRPAPVSAPASVEQADAECQIELPPSEDEILDWAGDYIQEALQVVRSFCAIASCSK